MSFRFQRSKKIAPGLRVNVSKRGIGFSAGPRGAKISASTSGYTSASVGIPGTGISYRKQGKAGSQARTRSTSGSGNGPKPRTRRKVIRVVYADADQKVELLPEYREAGGYAFFWPLQYEVPNVGDQVVVGSYAGEMSIATVVGFGRGGYQGELQEADGPLAAIRPSTTEHSYFVVPNAGDHAEVYESAVSASPALRSQPSGSRALMWLFTVLAIFAALAGLSADSETTENMGSFEAVIFRVFFAAFLALVPTLLALWMRSRSKNSWRS